MLFYIIVSVVLIALGIAILWNPRLYFKLTESWKHNGDCEPSDLFLLSARVGGIILVIVGVSVLAILLFVFST